MMSIQAHRIRSAAVVSAVLGALLLSGCAGPATDVDPSPSTGAVTTTSPSTASPLHTAPSVTPSQASPSEVGSVTDPADDPPTTHTSSASPSVDPDAPVALQEHDIEGAIVTTRSALDELPERASVVRFSRTLVDDGNGLELCIGGVAESLPPQCTGPVVAGLDPEGWTETQSGVTWGEREVVVEWPPVDGQLQLIASGPPNYPQPSEVEVEDPEGSYGLATLDAITDQLEDAGLLGTAGPVTYTAMGEVPGRVDVGLVVADHATIRQVLAVVDTPQALHMWGDAEVLG